MQKYIIDNLKVSLSKDYTNFNLLAYKIFYAVVADLCYILRNVPIRISEFALKSNRLSSANSSEFADTQIPQEQNYSINTETGEYNPNLGNGLTLARYVKTEKGFKKLKLKDFIIYNSNLLEVSQNAAKARFKSFFERGIWESTDKANTEKRLREFFRVFLEDLAFRVDYQAFSTNYQVSFKNLAFKKADLRRYSQLQSVSTLSNACLLICSGYFVAEELKRQQLARVSKLKAGF